MDSDLPEKRYIFIFNQIYNNRFLNEFPKLIQNIHLRKVYLFLSPELILKFLKISLKVFELDGGIFYEMNGGFQKEALERLVDYAYTAQLEIPGDEVTSILI